MMGGSGPEARPGAIQLLSPRSQGPWAMAVSSVLALALIAAVLIALDWEFVAELNFTVVWEYRIALAKGLGLTLVISGVAVVFGLGAGTVLAILLYAPVAPLRWLILAYVEVLRNTPLIVQLFWIHFALPPVTGYSTSALESGILAISLQASAYLTDIVRGGIQAVPRGQWEAANALGVPAWSRWIDVVLPQALKIMLPPLVSVAISFFRVSPILAVLSVGELMSTAVRVSEFAHKPIEVITFVGVVFFVFGSLFGKATRRLEVLTVRG